jgi:hypothetical protein
MLEISSCIRNALRMMPCPWVKGLVTRTAWSWEWIGTEKLVVVLVSCVMVVDAEVDRGTGD